MFSLSLLKFFPNSFYNAIKSFFIYVKHIFYISIKYFITCKYFTIGNIARGKNQRAFNQVVVPKRDVAMVRDEGYKGILRIIKGDIIFVYRTMKMRDDDTEGYT